MRQLPSRIGEILTDGAGGQGRHAQNEADPSGPGVSKTTDRSLLPRVDGSPILHSAGSLPPGLADHPDYKILRELGRGGMGVVYLAQNTLMGRMEVLKVVGSHLISRRGVLDRFLARDPQCGARLHHPNIVTAYTALRLGESLVLAMEYVEGLDLARLVKARGPLPVANACNYVHQAALGLQHAHEHGMVHRDIKPGNLMLARAGQPGDRSRCSTSAWPRSHSEGPADGGLTHEGQMLGTPDYIAPEQISDAQQADIRADIYSLGCTLYYLLTGGPPFQGDSLYDVLQAHHSMEATPLNLARPEVPVELAALVAKMMAKEPERRFQEPKEVAQAVVRRSSRRESQPPERNRPTEIKLGRAARCRKSWRLLEPATNNSRPLERPRGAASKSAIDKPWNTLIDIRETERDQHKASGSLRKRRPSSLRAVLAVGVLPVAFSVLLGMIFGTRRSDGIDEKPPDRLKITKSPAPIVGAAKEHPVAAALTARVDSKSGRFCGRRV